MNMDPAASGDWRQHLQPEARQRFVNKIMDTLQRHLPIYGQEGLGELRKIALRFEEKIYTAATNRNDYLWKISPKMLTMETKTQNSGVANQTPSNPSNQNPPDPDSMDSTAQASQQGPDWQEEICQKLQSMRELYFSDLNDVHQRMVLKCQQHEVLKPPGKHSEQLENMKKIKHLMDCMLTLLQMPKNNIQPGLKDKLPYFEKQMLNVIASFRKKNIPPQMQGQQQFPHPSGNTQSLTQPPSSQAPVQQHDSHGNQMPLIVQGSVTSMQSTAVSSIHNGSMPLSTHVGVPATQQNIMNSLQSWSNIDSSQGGALTSLQEAAMGSLQHG